MQVQLKVNGKALSVDTPPNTLLVQVLREQLQLTGTHVGCDTAQCGACTVIMNGRAVKSCNMLAAQAAGADITTIDLTAVTAIESFFETNSIGTMGGLVGSQPQPGDNLWTRLDRVEPNFIQNGDMTVTVTGAGYADGPDQTSAPYVYSPTTLKIDMREQRRQLRLRFESNTYNGDYQAGKVLLGLTTGDMRGTGNP